MTILFVQALRKLLPLTAFFSLPIILNSCKSDTGTADYAKGTKEGYELAKYHCSSCHKFVPASSLDKITWEKKTLPPMGKRLGVTILWESQYIDNENNTGGLHFKDWMKIVDYYLKTAPEKLTIPEPAVQPSTDSAIFNVHVPSYRTSSVSRTVLTAFDTIGGNIFTSDFYTNRLIKWNKDLKPIDSAQFFSPILCANFFTDESKESRAMFTNVGYMNPGNFELGSFLYYPSTKKLAIKADTLAKKLARPVHSTATDINNDGLTDYIVCEFGYTAKGGVFLLQQLQGGKFERKPIREWPGATMTIAKDFNNDGWTDVMALFAHDLESIRLYTNDHNGSFTETEIMSFPPVNGSTSFQLTDFNNDGLDDILYTCGDNADVSTIFKPYHGVYIFINKGKNQYEQAYFYQVNGCTKAVANDFDNDGDLDIAAIAFYGDFKNRPNEGFQYFEQTSPMNFKIHAVPVGKFGRWLTMDVQDYDKDGDKDIILGNLSRDLLIAKDYKPEWNEHIPFILLENNSRK